MKVIIEVTPGRPYLVYREDMRARGMIAETGAKEFHSKKEALEAAKLLLPEYKVMPSVS